MKVISFCDIPFYHFLQAFISFPAARPARKVPPRIPTAAEVESVNSAALISEVEDVAFFLDGLIYFLFL